MDPVVIESTKSNADWENTDFSRMSVDDRVSLMSRIWASLVPRTSLLVS